MLGITNYRDQTHNQNLSYDALNRITAGWTNASTGALAWGENYAIDPWGNMEMSPMGGKAHGGNWLCAADQNNRANCLGYDAAGNVVANGTAHYSFDTENRLASAGGMTYTYDADGNRVEKSSGSTGTLYWYGSPGIIAESDLSGNIQHEYVFFNGKRVARIDQPGSSVHYYLSDHLGSTSMVVSSLGAIEEESDYSPFGSQYLVSGSAANHYKFTGKERDSETGLDNFGARMYGNAFGRFTSPDPLLNSGKPWNPQTWNRYTYALNNPLRIIDPTGLYNLENTCGSGDSKCNKQFQQHAKDLKKGLSDLQKKVDKMKGGTEKDRLSASLKALGTENDGNNVNVKFGEVQNGAAHTDVTLDASQTKIQSFTVTFDASKISDSNSYAIDGAHEGTHITNFSDPRYASNGLSDFSDEYRAYQTSAWAAQALGVPNLSFGGNEIWNNSWKEADRATLQDKGITKQVIDHYHYPETQPHNPWPDK